MEMFITLITQVTRQCIDLLHDIRGHLSVLPRSSRSSKMSNRTFQNYAFVFVVEREREREREREMMMLPSVYLSTLRKRTV